MQDNLLESNITDTWEKWERKNSKNQRNPGEPTSNKIKFKKEGQKGKTIKRQGNFA